MFFRILRGDLSKNKAVALTNLLFVAVAGSLVSLAAILAVHLSGALDTLMARAETPHLLQMHSGEIDLERMAAFAERSPHVDEYQVLEFLNMDGARIRLGDRTLESSVQDNGFSVQSDKFDYLLDLDGNVIAPADGELYVPVSYRKDYAVRIGDEADIGGISFAVAGFLRDSQMNSTLSASKRFLVSARDYEAIRPAGSVEYLIEFRLQDLASLGAFEAAYDAAELEANGPRVTYPLFRLLNALSDGIMIGAILLIGLLVVAVALLCIRFALLAQIEEDYREIGVLKAIGLRVSHIKRLYLAKYAAIAVAGGIIGFAISAACKDMLLEQIRESMGESANVWSPPLFGIAGALLVSATVIAYVSRVLNRFRRLSAAQAIRFGVSRETKAGARRLTLTGNRLLPVNGFLGVQDVLARKPLYGTLLAVLVLSTFILIVPQNLHATISSSGFTRYMGIGSYDIRIDLQQTAPSAADPTAEIVEALRGDADVVRYAVLTTKVFPVQAEDGSEQPLQVELGDHSLFPIAYADGRAPAAPDEIALSALYAEALGRKVGDVVTLRVKGEARALAVSGIYSDITNGGRTAKAVFDDDSAPVMRSVICVDVAHPSLIDAKAAAYANEFAYAKVSDIEEFIAQTFGSTIRAVQRTAYAAAVVALVVAALVTLLFMKLLVAKDRYAIAVLKSIGFTGSDITAQYVARAAIVVIVGIGLGALLANTLGEGIAGALISSLGAASFRFTVSPLAAYVASPLMIAGAVLIAAIAGASDARRIRISEHVKGAGI